MDYNRIENYGVILKRLTHDKIELVRRWRNDPKISQYMEYREEITPEMQERWFQRINNDYNFYYIVEYEGRDVGLVNIRDVDYDKMTGEPGVFFWDDECLNSLVPFRASACMSILCFDILKLKMLIIHVLSTNKRAIKYNKARGYVLSPNQENVFNQEYTLTRERSMELREKLTKYL